MNNYDESNQFMLCSVCNQSKSKFYPIADCGHVFCQQCCIAYIDAKAISFDKAKCLQDNCGAELNKDKYIYTKLSAQTISKIDKFQRFDFLQKKTDAKICKVEECSGYFLKNDKKGQCIVCKAQHCNKCYQFKHGGQCITSTQEKKMRELHYRQCPQCNIWVEKIAGCEFISCKCGIQFCYKCGTQFSKDPCRKQPLWQQQFELRRLLKELQSYMPTNIKKALLMIPKIILTLIMILPFTIIFCTLPLIVSFGVSVILIFIISPLMLAYPISTIIDKKKRIIGYLALIIFYPLIGSVFTLIFILIILLYPLVRQKYHHGIYDPIDLIVSKFAVWYIKVVIMAFNCTKSCC